MMTDLLLVVAFISIVVTAGLFIVRRADRNLEDSTWKDLRLKGANSKLRFNSVLLDGLPDVVRRYFQFTIKPNATLHAVAEISISGEFGLGDSNKHKYFPMRAHQLLAPPYGLVWKVVAGKGLSKIVGSDGIDCDHSWTRFWVWGILPLVRAGENEDHLRSAFGRVVAESVFWAPAALLPENGVTWREIDNDTAEASMAYGNHHQTVNITVAANGMPTKVVIQRWSNANPQKRYQLQSFGGYLSAFQEFSGYVLPTIIEGGNFIDTADYFPFYKARVVDLKFVD
jgi:hypothetical protein